MHRLNLNLLRSLHALLTLRNVTHAADQLCLTQSAMSRNLAQLREYFQDPLLVRQGSQYVMTDQAVKLAAGLSPLLEQIDAFLQEKPFVPQECERRFVLASSDYVAHYIYPHVVRRLAAEAPGIVLDFALWQPSVMTAQEQRNLDLVATMQLAGEAGYPDGWHGKLISRDDYPVLLMGAQHPLANNDSLLLSQILDYGFIHINSGGDKEGFFDHYLSRQGLTRRIENRVPVFSAAFSLLCETNNLLIVPIHIANTARKNLPLRVKDIPISPDWIPEFCYWLRWPMVHQSDPAHIWLREQVLESIYSPGILPFQ